MEKSTKNYAKPAAANIPGRELRGKKILIIVENLPCPFDRRVWQEARALKASGAGVSIICPMGKGYEKAREVIEGIAIYRHPLPVEAAGPIGYLLEYGAALFWEFKLAWQVLWERGFDVIHACNPPDLIYLIAGFFCLFGKKFLFDHHDLNPELYVSKFNRKDRFYKLLLYFERQTFRLARISLSPNISYKDIALKRGRKAPEDVFIVRSCPDLEHWQPRPPLPALKKGRTYLVGYLGVMGRQEGLDYLVDACAWLVNEQGRADIHFICIGDGTEREHVMAYTGKRGVSAYFTFTGRVPDQVVLQVLSTADVCVNTDSYNDFNNLSSMNKILEYMALKKPIVQFDLKEGRFSAGQASLYARPDNPADLARKIEQLLGNPGQRKQMGEYGYKRLCEVLGWPFQTRQLIQAYRRLFRLPQTIPVTPTLIPKEICN